jgi:hypothetical protein
LSDLVSVVLAGVGLLTALMLLRTLTDMRRMLYTLLARGDDYPQPGDRVVHRKNASTELFCSANGMAPPKGNPS